MRKQYILEPYLPLEERTFDWGSGKNDSRLVRNEEGERGKAEFMSQKKRESVDVVSTISFWILAPAFRPLLLALNESRLAVSIYENYRTERVD